MRIKLSYELKVKLLEAIKDGELETSLIPSEYDEITGMTEEQLNMCLIRHYEFEDRDYIRAKAELLMRYAGGEIQTSQFREEMLALMNRYDGS